MSLSARMRVRELFTEFYAVEVMENPTPEAMDGYLNALKRWEQLTADPPLEQITSATMADFKQRLRELTIRGGKKLAINTVRKHLDHIQWILDQAGPPAAVNRLRTAAGLLDRVPWTKPPKREKRKKPPTSEDLVVGLYRAAEHAIFPVIPGITAAAWWRALLSTICSTSLRIGQLVRLPYAAVVWDPQSPELRLTADVCRKSKADETKPLHPVAFRDLLAMRGERELLFPAWPRPHSKTTIYHEFHRLELLAGFVPQQGVALHGVRRFVLTELGIISPTAAQIAAGHESYQTTIEHYIGVGALDRAVRQLTVFDKLAQ